MSFPLTQSTKQNMVTGPRIYRLLNLDLYAIQIIVKSVYPWHICQGNCRKGNQILSRSLRQLSSDNAKLHPLFNLCLNQFTDLRVQKVASKCLLEILSKVSCNVCHVHFNLHAAFVPWAIYHQLTSLHCWLMWAEGYLIRRYSATTK